MTFGVLPTVCSCVAFMLNPLRHRCFPALGPTCPQFEHHRQRTRMRPSTRGRFCSAKAVLRNAGPRISASVEHQCTTVRTGTNQ